MAVVCRRPGVRGRVYLAADVVPKSVWSDDADIRKQLGEFCLRTGLTIPDEQVITDAKNANFCVLYGLDQFCKRFIPKQLFVLLNFVSAIREAHQVNVEHGALTFDRARAVTSILACYLDRGADHWSSLCAWNPVGEKLQHTFGRQAIPMVWDFSEAHPWGGSVGDWMAIVENGENAITAGISSGHRPAKVTRGSATSQPWESEQLDAVITDPPYYDNVPYVIGDNYLSPLATIRNPQRLAGKPSVREPIFDAARR